MDGNVDTRYPNDTTFPCPKRSYTYNIKKKMIEPQFMDFMGTTKQSKVNIQNFTDAQ